VKSNQPAPPLNWVVELNRFAVVSGRAPFLASLLGWLRAAL